jgi:WD40 repeat protein/tetratricopeptide (TPR) repeat protein
MWDVRNERTAFLSTDLTRPKQAEFLWDAALADIITACCSAPVFFPARWFRRGRNESAFCDGGITGLNSPATFGVSLLHLKLAKEGVPLQVISFGAGEAPELENSQEAPTVGQLRNRTLVQLAPDAINALMTSTSRLMNQFYDAFGVTLNVVRYLRTNHPRNKQSALDDAASIPRLARQFSDGAIYYDLWCNSGKVVERKRRMPKKGSTCEWSWMWKEYFGLEPTVCAPGPHCEPSRVVTESMALDGESGYIASGEIRPTLRAILTAPMIIATILGLLFAGAILGFSLREQAKLERQKAELADNERMRTETEKQKVALENHVRWVREAEHNGIKEMERGEWLSALPYFLAALKRDQALSQSDSTRDDVHRLRIAGVLAACPILVNHQLLPASPTMARFMPNGNQILVVCENGKAYYVDANSENVTQLPLDHIASPRNLGSLNRDRLSPNGTLLLGQAKLLDPLQVINRETTNPAFVLNVNRCGVASFSSSDKYLAADTDEGCVVWDLESKERIAGPIKPRRRLASIQFSAQKARLLIVDGGDPFDIPLRKERQKALDLDAFASIWKLDRLTKADFKGYGAAALSQDGRLLAIGRNSGGIDVVNIDAEATVLHLAGPEGGLQQLQFAPNGEWLLGVYGRVMPEGGRISIWQVSPDNSRFEPGQPLRADIETNAPVDFVRLSPDATMLLVVCSTLGGRHQLRVFDVASGNPVCPHLPSNAKITAAEFSPEGRRIVVTSADRLLKVWELASPFQVAPSFAPTSPKPLLPARVQLRGEVIADSLDGKRRALIPRGEFPTVYIPPFLGFKLPQMLVVMETESNKHLAQIPAANLREAAFSNTGRYLFAEYLVDAGGDSNRFVRVVDLDRGGAGDLTVGVRLSAISLAPDESYLVSDGREASLYTLADGIHLSTRLDLSRTKSWKSAISPSGERLVVWADSFDNGKQHSLIQVHKAKTGKPISPLWECSGRVSKVRFSSDERWLFTIAGNRVARWSISAAGSRTEPDLLHASQVEEVLFSPSAMYAATLTQSDLRIWNTASGAPLSSNILLPSGRETWCFRDDALLVSEYFDGLSLISLQSGEPVLPPYETMHSLNWSHPRIYLNGSPAMPEVRSSTKIGDLVRPNLDGERLDLRPAELTKEDLYFRAPLLCGQDLNSSLAPEKISAEVAQSRWREWNNGTARNLQSRLAGQILWHERIHRVIPMSAVSANPKALLMHSEALFRLDPMKGERAAQLGIDRFNSGDYRPANESLENAIKLGTDNAGIRTSQAEVLIELKQWQEAEAALRGATEMGGKSEVISLLKRRIAFRRGSWRELTKQVDAIPIKVRDKNAGALYDRGWAYAELGDFKLALQDFQRATALRGSHDSLDLSNLHELIVSAHAYLADGDRKAYSEVCGSILSRYERLTTEQVLLRPPVETQEVSWTCSLTPNAHSESPVLLRLVTATAMNIDDEALGMLTLAQVLLRRDEGQEVLRALNLIGKQVAPHVQAYSALFKVLASSKGLRQADRAAARANAIGLATKALSDTDSHGESPSWTRRQQLKRLIAECEQGEEQKTR